MGLRDRMLGSRVNAPPEVREPQQLQAEQTTKAQIPSEKNYYYINRNEPEKLHELLNILDSADRFAFDFETTSADPLSRTEEQRIVGISFSWVKDTACYLPIGHDTYGANWVIEVLQHFKPIFEDPKKLKIAYNAKFECHWLKKVGINLSLPIFDPMLGINLMKQLYPDIGLKTVVEQVFGYQMLTYEEITGYVSTWTGEYFKSGKNKGQKKYANRQRKFNEVPVDDRCLEYTCADSDWALQLADIVAKQLRDEGLYELCTEIDIPLMPCLVDLELNGWHVDPERFKQLKKQAEKKLEEVRTAIMVEIRKQLRLPVDDDIIVPTGKVHKPFNINSTAHLRWLLYDQLQLPVLNSTDTGQPSTNAETLEKLSTRVDIPLFSLVMEYKVYSKILSTYLVGYASHIRENNRIHSSIDQVFVSTGRFASKEPNLQNAPRADNDPMGVRSCFVAPTAELALCGEDSLYLFCDYSQIELRVFAWYAQEPAMLDAFYKGQDLHGRTAWEMYELGKTQFELDGVMHDPIDVGEVKSVAPIYRTYAKSINFGIIYGLTAPGLANDLWKDTSDEAVRKGQGLLNRYLQTYSRVTEQQRAFIADARRNGYTQTMFGRRRVLPDINSHIRFKRQLAERQACNAPVQGSASEIIKLAMIRLHQQAPPWLKMVMQIHDELVFEVPASKILQGVEIVQRIMQIPVPGFDVPIVAEADLGVVWGQTVGIQDGTVKIKEPDKHQELVRRLELGGVKIVTN